MRSIIATDPQPDAVLISLCDQPLVTAEKLRPFVETFARSRPNVIAAHYNDVAGVPALFSAKLYPDLASLKGDKGAREIIRNSPDAVTIPLPDAGIDVDTQSDLTQLT
jgi:molybdenum cofactor cytidylyltransferase